MNIIALLMFVALALGGRWMQLHPEKIVPKGWLVSEKSFGAKLLHAEATVIGGFAVFLGTTFGLSTVLQLLTFGHAVLRFLTWCVAITIGVFAARYVRKEVRNQPPYNSMTPYGWWP
jgi:membrane protein implicated in regulation of membrane protease activity